MIKCSWCGKRRKFGWSKDKKTDPKRFIMCDNCFSLGNEFDVVCGQANRPEWTQEAKKWKKVYTSTNKDY